MSTNTDETVIKDLIETLEDGRQGFDKGAEHLDSSDNPSTAQTFRRFAEQRATFASELRSFATIFGTGNDMHESGSVAGTLHRGWMSLKDALSGSDPSGILTAAEKGEDHAVEEYESALNDDITPALRVIVERQYADVKAARDQVRALARANH